MAITFHCEHCGKKIEASDSSVGKWGKCPACHNKIYVPDLSSDEELKLAPIDQTDEVRQKQLMDETFNLTKNILLEKEIPADSAASVSDISDRDLTIHIITYLRQMADGQLEQAEETAKLLTPCDSRTVKLLDKIALSEVPEPELADIPSQVLSGLVRRLRSRIS
jgi:DNA-directed RNA polymerase subunit RPC12/RpoP